jgi:hypothetical protein
MNKAKWKKLYRILRVIEKRALKTNYRFYYDLLFCENTDHLDRHDGCQANSRIVLYKTWGF